MERAYRDRIAYLGIRPEIARRDVATRRWIRETESPTQKDVRKGAFDSAFGEVQWGVYRQEFSKEIFNANGAFWESFWKW